ncbi:PilN domain-containing protein [bacterium]|nr:PilN domain-containing protein [bacterium]
MIRINLLPRKPKPPVVLYKDSAVLCGAIFLLLIIMSIIMLKMNGRVNELKMQVAETRKQIESSELDLQKIQKLKDDKAILENKIKIIDTLKKKQEWPVHVMEELGFAIPEQVWLNNLVNQGDSLRLEGMTPSYNAISEFMQQLDKSPYFKGIDLQNLRQTVVKGKKFHTFSIRCQIEFLPAKTDEKGGVS